MDNLIKSNKIVKKKKIAKGLDRTVLTGSYGPTPVLAVYEINKKIRFFMLKKSVFIPVFSFHGPTSRSGPVLKTTGFFLFSIYS